MSLRVFVIPEDFRTDQYVLKPLVGRMLEDVGRPRAQVEICIDPLLGGIGEAKKWDRISRILLDYRYKTDLFLLIVDRDCEPGRRAALDGLELKAAVVLEPQRRFLGQCAWQEIEAWALAGQEFPADGTWKTIREERDVKEKFFEPLARSRNLDREPGGGRTTLGREAAANYDRVRSRCPEIVDLQQRIAEWLASRSP